MAKWPPYILTQIGRKFRSRMAQGELTQVFQVICRENGRFLGKLCMAHLTQVRKSDGAHNEVVAGSKRGHHMKSWR